MGSPIYKAKASPFSRQKQPTKGGSFTLESQEQLSRRGHRPVFAKVNPLPSTKGEPAIGNRNQEARAEQGCFDMCRHIVGAFIAMAVIERLGDNMVDRHLEIDPDIRVGIFVNGE
jgi:formaldehyde-activating enzyme involved in methanogenesis